MGTEADTIPAAEARYVGYGEAEAGKWMVEAILVGPRPSGCEPRATLYKNGQQVASVTEKLGTLVRIPRTEALDPSVPWTVQLAWVSGGTPGPSSPPLELPVVAPLLRSVAADAKVRVDWGLAPGPPYSTGVQLLLKGGKRPSGKVIMGAEEVSCSPEPPLEEGVVYSATVAAMRGSAEGPTSEPVIVPYIRTPIASTAYDGETLTVTWSGADPAETSGCRIELLRGSVQVGEFLGTGGAGSAEVELDPGAAYQVRLRWLSDRGSGPAGPSAPVISAVATVSALTVTASTVEATVKAPTVAAGVSRYVADLYEGERLLGTSPPVAATPPAVAKIPFQDGRGGDLSVRVRALSSETVPTAEGQPGPPAALIASGPRILRAGLDDGVLELRWELPAAAPGAIESTTIVIKTETGTVVRTLSKLPGTAATETLPDGLIEATKKYTVQAIADSALGTSLPGPPQSLLAGAPTVAAAEWDGERLQASWSWPSAAGGAEVATAYRLELLGGGVRRGAVVVGGLSGILVPEAPLDPSGSIQIAVSALAPGTEFSGTPVTGPIWGAPVLEAAEVLSGAAEVQLTWTAPAGAVSGYVAVFRCEGAPDKSVSLAAGATSPVKVALPATLTDPLVGATVSLRATGAGGKGPTSAALPLVLSAPAVEAVEYDVAADGTRTVTVGAAPALGPVDGYETRASWDPTAAVFSAGPRATMPVSSAPTVASHVEIAARRGAGLGPSEVAGGTQLVLGAPRISARTFDGARLSVEVTPSTEPSAAPTGYRVELLRGEVVVERAELPAPQPGEPLSLPVGRPEEPTAAHSVRVRTRSGISLGPAAEAPVTFAAPDIASVSVGAAIEAELVPGALPSAGLTMEAHLVVDGTPGVPVAAGAQGKVKFALPMSGKSWALAACAKYSGVSGPWSEPVAVPSAAPASLAADYSNGRLRASWAGDSEAVYLARVLAADVELAGARVQGTEAELRFAPPTDGAMAELSVQEVAGVATGPVETLTLVTASRAASAVTSQDQSTVTVSWDATKFEPPPTGFVPVISWEGETRELPEVPVKVSSADVPLAGVPAGAVGGVRAKAGTALGPLGETATVVLGRPTDLNLEWEEGELVASWVPPELSWDEAAVLKKTIGSNTIKVADLQGSHYRLPLSPSGEETTLGVAATAAGGTGAATSAPVLFEAPLITAMAWDGRALTLSWKGGGGSGQGGAYLVTVSDRGRVVAERTVTASTATLAVSGLSDEATVSVVALAAGADWPRWRSAGPATKLAVPVAAPAISAVAIDPGSGNATVSWSEVAGATGYELQAYLDGVPAGDPVSVKAPEKSARPAKPPAAGQDLTVAVRAVVATSETTRKGPGPGVPVLTAAPEIAAVEFDGVAVTVSWRPVAGADGYTVSIVGGSPASVFASGVAPAGATSLRLAPQNPIPISSYQVAVQARRGSSTGVAATAPLFQRGLYLRSSPGGPAILPTASERLEAEAVSAYLPPLGKTTLSPLPIEPPQAGESQPPFKLAANTDPAGKATLPYVLTIAAGALSFEPARSGLQDTYRALLVAAEQAGAGPQGIFALQQAISRLMPQTFAETLYYAYGLSPFRLCVDLRPGMILRVAAPGFDLTAVDSVPAPAGWATGYAPGGTIDLAIDDYLTAGAEPEWRVGFDSFLATLAASGALEVPAPETPETPDPSPNPVDVVETGGADAADLFYDEFRNPYYRLLIPAAVQAANEPTTVRTSQQFAIAGAPTWAQIDARPPGAEVKVAYFRGRAVLRPCIRVEVNERERVVPVGTTVGNLLDGLGRRPPSTARPLVGLRLERALGPAVLDPTAPYDVGASARVNLDWLGLVTMAPGVDALSLPLLHGDRLSLEGGG